MKKKIIFGLALFAMVFFFGGIYIVMTTERTIYELHSLSQLHHVVALRKDLLISLEKNQEKIRLRGTKYTVLPNPPGEMTMVDHVTKCLACHQSSPAGEKSRGTIVDLKNQVEAYQSLTEQLLSEKVPAERQKPSEELVLKTGNDLVRKMEELIIVTGNNLSAKERAIIDGISRRKKILFLLVTTGPLFALGLTIILIRGLTRPVNSLLAATRRLKAGDLDYRIEGLQDEFREVADSFNEMAASLKKQMQELQRTEQLRVCGEIAAGLAHEIRNPLAGMKISIEILLQELNLTEKDRDILSKVNEQIRHIEILMKNILNYARPVAAQLMMVDVNKILEKTVYFIEKHPSFTSGERSKKIIKEFDANLPETLGDPQQLQQVLLNLFLNASDVTPEGGAITVRTFHDKQKGALVIELQDAGGGIPSQLMDKIFQPFVTTKGKGTGLGLAVSKRIIEEHGGAIRAMNNAIGGATFRIGLPVKSERSEAA